MKSTLLNSIWAVSLLAAVAMPIRLAAQEQSATQGQKPEPTRYIVTDLGTLEGGTSSQPFFINRYGLKLQRTFNSINTREEGTHDTNLDTRPTTRTG